MVTHSVFKLVRDINHTVSKTQMITSLQSNMEIDTEAPKNFTDKLPNIITAIITQMIHKSASHCICVPHDNSARSNVMLPIMLLFLYMHKFFELLKTTSILHSVL